MEDASIVEDQEVSEKISVISEKTSQELSSDDLSADGGVDLDKTAWWLDFMEEEGYLQRGKQLIQNGTLVGADDLNEEDATEQEGKKDKTRLNIDDDDESVDDETEDDWKERLWVVSRNHWNYDYRDYIASPNVNELGTTENTEMALLNATIEDSKDQKHILMFRNQLLACIVAFIHVFGDIPFAKDGSEDGEQNLLQREARRMSPYVPLNVARRLFCLTLVTIKSTESQIEKEVTECERDEENSKDKIQYFAEHVTQVLFSPEINVFRTYMVESQPYGSSIKIEGNFVSKGGKRVRTDRITDPRRRQREMEKLLYGEMYLAENKEEIDETEISHGDPDCPEEEVRIRQGIANLVKKLALTEELPGYDIDWTLPFLCEVLVDGLISDSLSDEPLSISNFISARVDRSSETSLDYTYAIRYFPHFFLRSFWKNSQPETLPITFLTNNFCDPRFIKNRLVVLGIFQGVTVHVGELEALFQELAVATYLNKKDKKDFFRNIHSSIGECLTFALEESMTSADFLPIKTAYGVDWKITDIKDRPSSRNETDHTKIVSICIEIGKAFQYQGVAIGKREQERMSKQIEVNDVLQQRNFDDAMTELEVDAYLEAQSAYHGALKVLTVAELQIKENYRAQLQESSTEDIDDDNVLTSSVEAGNTNRRFDSGEAKALKHIDEARITVELYLADTLTTLAYCYEAKLSNFQLALTFYKEALNIYAKHAGKNHSTVLNTLQSIGVVNLKLEQWDEARRCFEEWLELVRRRLQANKPKGSNGILQCSSTLENNKVATVLKCLGFAQSKLGSHDTAFDNLSKSIDQMSLNFFKSKESTTSKVSHDVLKPPCGPFICDALSKMTDCMFSKLSSLKMEYVRKRLTMLYGEEETFDVDLPRLTQLQVERKTIEIVRDAVSMRRSLSSYQDSAKNASSSHSLSDKSINESHEWLKQLDFMNDLISMGKLLFRRRDYDKAIQIWEEALELLDNSPEYDQSMDKSDKTPMAVKSTLIECHEKRVDRISAATYLCGIASCRIGSFDEAIKWFEKSITQFEEKRKIYTDRESSKVYITPDNDSWDVLDLDVGCCEHALGLAHFYNSQFTAADAHYRESLRLLEATAVRHKTQKQQHGSFDNKRRGEFETSINSSIAAVMMSMGTLYQKREKTERARRFLEGAIQIVYWTTHQVLTSSRNSTFTTPSVTGFNEISLVVCVIRVGDAHRRIALMNKEKKNLAEAKLAFETSIRCLESTNIETRLSLKVDDEAHIESIHQDQVDGMLLSCYENMMDMISPSEAECKVSTSRKWWDFTDDDQDLSGDDSIQDGLTREDLLFRLGNISAKRKKFDSAIRCFIQARQLTEDKLGTTDHPIIGNILFNLGNVYRQMNKFNTSENRITTKNLGIDAFVESLRITKLMSGPDSLVAAEVMESLATLLMEDDAKPFEVSRTDNDGAMKFLRDAVAIRDKNRSEMSLQYSISVHHLGILRLRHIFEECNEDVFRDKSILDEAVFYLSQALHIRRIILGDHLDAAESANALGVALWKKSILSDETENRKKEMIYDAMKHLEDALFIRMSVLERESRCISKDSNGQHSETSADIINIGSVVVKTVETLYDIACIHERQEDFETQHVFLNDALQLMDKWTEKQDRSKLDELKIVIPDSERSRWKAKLFYCLGTSWYERGKFSQAVKYFDESLVFYELDDSAKVDNADHVFDDFFCNKKDDDVPTLTQSKPSALVLVMEKLADAYNKLEKFEDALCCYAFCLISYDEQFGHGSLQVGNILRRVGKIYGERHDHKRCVRALQRALHVRDSINGGEYETRLEDTLVFLQLAHSLTALGVYDEAALENYQSAVGILEDIHQLSQDQDLVDNTISPPDNSNNAGARFSSEHNTYELLLQGYSAILVLIRRKNEKDPEDEQHIIEVIHHIGNTHAALRQYNEALTSLRHVLNHQRRIKGSNHLSVADLLFNLGNIHIELGQIDEARECHHECHDISSTVLGNDSIELAENMMCLGNIEFLASNFSSSLEWFDDALRLLKKREEYEIAVAKCLHRKAVSHDKLGEYENSIECFGQVLRLGRKIWGTEHIELSNVLNSVGNVHRNRGEMKRALKCYEESLRIRIKVKCELSIANTKNNIGALFMSIDRIDRARLYYAESLRIKTKILGPNHIEIARALYNMGQLLSGSMQFKKSLRFFSEALQIFKRDLGKSHGELASCLCSIGTAYDEMSEDELAFSYFNQALEAVAGQKNANEVRASSLHNIGIILAKKNDIDNAAKAFREALELKSTNYESIDLSDTQYCLANVLRLMDSIDEAIELHKEALYTRTKYLGPDHADVANSMFGLAQALVERSEHNDAIGLLDECIEIRRMVHGEKSNSLADAVFFLGITLRDVGRLAESLQHLKATLEVKTSLYGDDHSEIADISFKLAIVLCEMGKYDEAKKYYLASLRIQMAQDNKDEDEIAATLLNLGIVEQRLGDHQLALENMKKALELRQVSDDESSQDLAAIIHAMGQSQYELENFDDAIRLFEEAINRNKALYGNKHIEVTRTIVDEGRAFERIAEYERALMCYEEAVDSECYEENSQDLGLVFMRMGIIHFSVGNSEDSWDCLTEATRIFELEDRRERITIQNQSLVHSKQDKTDLIKCFQCILHLAEADPNRYNIDRSLIMPKVATALADMKQYEKAAMLYRDAIELQRSLPGDTRFLVAMNLHNLGNCLYYQGDLTEAITCLEDALALLEDTPGVEGKHVADTYQSIAFVHESRSDMQEALTCYSNALKSRRMTADVDSTSLVSILTSMGEVLRTLGMYDAAIKSCKDALRLLDSRFGSNLLLAARIVECIGLTHRDRFEYEKALRCYKECLKQRQDAEGMDSIYTAKTLRDMAIIYSLKGETEKASDLLRESLRVFQLHLRFDFPTDQPQEGKEAKKAPLDRNVLSEKVSQYLEKGRGENLVDYAKTIVTFASVIDTLGWKDEAVTSYQIVVTLLEDTVDKEHLISAQAKHSIGTIMFQQGAYHDSLIPLEESLYVRRMKLGNEHISTEETLKMISRAYAASGNSEMALEHFKEVRDIKKKRFSSKADSESEADLLLRLGKLHLEQQEYADALTSFKDSLRLQRQSSITRDEQKLAETLQYMGSTLLEIHQLQEARLTLLSALRLLEHGKEDGKGMMASSYLLGRVNEEEWSFDKALAWYNRSLAILNNCEKPDEEMKARIITRVGLVQFAQKSFEDALKSVKEAQDIFEDKRGVNNLDYADCLHSCGRIHFQMKEQQMAKEMFQSALQIRQQHLKHDDPEIGESYHCLGAVLIELEQFDEANSCLAEALRIRVEIFGNAGYHVCETQRCLGFVKLHLGRPDESTNHFLEAIRVGMDGVQVKSDLAEEGYENLMACFDAVTPMAKDSLDSERLGKLYYQKGSLQSMHKRYNEALRSFAEAIQVYKASCGEEHLTVANALYNIGVCLKECGENERAVKSFSRALDITTMQLGEDSIQVAETTQQLAEVYNMQGDIKGAIAMCEQALQIRRSQEDLSLAALLNFSGELYTRYNNGDEAERCFRECVRIRKNLLGDDHLDVAQALYNLGYIHETYRNDFRRALRCYEESLRIRLDLMEGVDEGHARCYLHLGTTHSALHVETKAFFCFEKAMEISNEIDYHDSTIVEDALIGQGHALLARGDAVEALVQYERARGVRQGRINSEKMYSEEVADVLVLEANALIKLSKQREAMSKLVQALDTYKKSVGMNHLGTGEAFQRLSELHLEMEENEEALICAQQALDIRKSLLGKHDDATGDTYFILGKIFFDRADLATAAPCLQAALETFRHRRGPNHISVTDSMYCIGCVHECRKELNEAIACFQETLTVRQKAYGRDHLLVADVLFRLGTSHKKRGEADLGSDCLAECLRIRTIAKGEDDVSVADALFELAGTLGDSLPVSANLDPTQCYVDAIRIYRQAQGEYLIKIAKCLACLAKIMESKKNAEKASNCFKQAVGIFEAKLSLTPTHEELVDYRIELDYEAYIGVLLDYANFLDVSGHDSSAMENYHHAVGLLRSVRGENDGDIDNVLSKVAGVLDRKNRSEEALQLLQTVKERRISAMGGNHPSVATTLYEISKLLDKKHDYESAIESLEECLRIRRATIGRFSEIVAFTLLQIGVVQAHDAKYEEAICTWDDALTIYKRAGLHDEDVAVLNVLEYQENARHMLDTLNS